MVGEGFIIDETMVNGELALELAFDKELDPGDKLAGPLARRVLQQAFQQQVKIDTDMLVLHAQPADHGLGVAERGVVDATEGGFWLLHLQVQSAVEILGIILAKAQTSTSLY